MVPKRRAGAKREDLFAAQCKITLDQCWAEVLQRLESDNAAEYVTDPVLAEAIRKSLDESTDKTYHYVLITQLVAKVTDPTLNARSLQEGSRVEGSFDPRTLCKKVVVPFDGATLDGALGRSPDPYVNNPVRVPLLTKADRKSKSDPSMWDQLCDVVDAVETARNPEFTRDVFRQVLRETYRKLGGTEIKFDVPLRASLEDVVTTIERFTSEQSGGDRPLAVTAALFQIAGAKFKLFNRIRRGKITTSDKASGQVADIECLGIEDNIVIAVEVKDRTVKVSDLEEKLPSTRKKQITEIFFVSAKPSMRVEGVPERVAKEFNAGQNLYVFNLIDLARSIPALAGETSRRDFLTHVGEPLDAYSDTKHRLAWKTALQEMSGTHGSDPKP